MAIVQWFTQPAQSFSSFYYYDNVSRDFVRIRLELGRKDDDDTLAMYRPNRYVGFRSVSLTEDERKTLIVENGKIKFKQEVLIDQPEVGKYVIDFTAANGKPLNLPHAGNKVIDNNSALLPKNITIDVLKSIAGKVISNKDAKVFFTHFNATGDQLSQALLNYSK